MEELRFLMLCGIPASGKSRFAKGMLGDREDVVYLSSDEIREELYNNVNSQENNARVFEVMKERTIESFENNKHVVYDATNINRRRRELLLKELSSTIHKTVVYMATDYETAIEQNVDRDRTIPEDVIDKMYKNFQIPIYSEGWDEIIFEYHDDILNNELPHQFTEAVRVGVLLGREKYELMGFLATYFQEFFEIYELAQDSKNHCFSVSRYTYHTYKCVLDNYETEDEKDKEIMLWTALLHDIGKAHCKSFIDHKGEEFVYANFTGHENVGVQKAISILKRLNFSEEFIHAVATLVQFHMYPLNSKESRTQLSKRIGMDNVKRLVFLRKANLYARGI